jgi:hypothetical protein
MSEFGCASALLSLSNQTSESENNAKLLQAPSKELKNAVLNPIYVEMQSMISLCGNEHQEKYGLLKESLNKWEKNIHGLIKIYIITMQKIKRMHFQLPLRQILTNQ